MAEKESYPLAVALEKAGYSILKFECVLKSVYDTTLNKAYSKPVMQLEITPSDDAKRLFIGD